MAEPDDELMGLARRAIWWEPPEEALSDVRRLLCYVMALGTWDDAMLARRRFGDDAFRQALLAPRPGVFDKRSWRFWRLRFGLDMNVPLPHREGIMTEG